MRKEAGHTNSQGIQGGIGEQDPQGGHGGWTMVKDHSVVRWTCPQYHPGRRALKSRKSVCVVSSGLSSLLQDDPQTAGGLLFLAVN